MCRCCSSILEANNLPQEYAQTILMGINLENMRRTWESLIKLYYSGDADAFVMINELSARLNNIIQRRNGTVHACWSIGWGNDQTESFEIATSLKGQRNIGKRGHGGIKYTLADTKDFDDIIDEIQKLTSLVWRFTACIGRAPPSANFSYNDKGQLIDKPPKDQL
jgi:hypothetical protein